MKEIEANKQAWGQLSKVHYEHYKKALLENKHSFSTIIENELGDISGKTIVHLQCNTGADSVLLAQKGAIVTGVDLIPDNIFMQKKCPKNWILKILSLLNLILWN